LKADPPGRGWGAVRGGREPRSIVTCRARRRLWSGWSSGRRSAAC